MAVLDKSVKFEGRDQVTITYIWKSDRVQLKSIALKGSLPFLRSTSGLLRQIFHNRARAEIESQLATRETELLPLVVDLMDLVLEKSSRPYKDEELCHCRVVPTQKVVEAIHYGADNVIEIARKTSAGTGCGTCQIQSQKLIQHYRQSS